MLDFTSALYLGLSHPSASLAPWRALTLGRPAALEEPPGARKLGRELAELLGTEAAAVFPSTLHLFRDAFQIVATPGSVLLFDASAYPIARWGAERAQLAGTPVETFPHHDADALERRLRKMRRTGMRPVIVTDGLCPSCGRLAPLPALARLAADAGGRLVVDDTQALGVLGRMPAPDRPLGMGGAGSLAWHGLSASPHVLVGASLAKGFGAPLAVLAGHAKTIGSVLRDGETRIHTSPPSVADIAAARRALASNRADGEGLRARIVQLAEKLRADLRRIGLEPNGALPMPMQNVAMPSLPAARAALTALDAAGMRGLITRSCRDGAPRLTLLITARHGRTDIERLTAALARVAARDVRLQKAA